MISGERKREARSGKRGVWYTTRRGIRAHKRDVWKTRVQRDRHGQAQRGVPTLLSTTQKGPAPKTVRAHHSNASPQQCNRNRTAQSTLAVLLPPEHAKHAHSITPKHTTVPQIESAANRPALEAKSPHQDQPEGRHPRQARSSHHLDGRHNRGVCCCLFCPWQRKHCCQRGV